MTDRLDQNPKEAERDAPMVECPANIEFGAGAIYTMTCFINKVSVSELALVSQATGAAKFNSSIREFGANFV